MKQLLQTLVEEFHQQLKLELADSVVREAKFPDIPNKIKVAIGMRRTGKTVFVMQQIKKMLDQKLVELSQVLYLDFEDDRLQPMNCEELAKLVDAFYSVFPENHNKSCCFFFDEIQNVDGWPSIVRRLQKNKNITIYLTGSSAKLLSKEIATSLRGRSVSAEIWPYSFNEYLLAKKIKLSKDFPASVQSKHKKEKLLAQYLQEGGFPETIGLDMINRFRLLQDYVDIVILRDIIERHKITNISLLRYLIKVLVKNAASPFSTNKLYNDIKSQGFSLSKDTLYEYMGYIEDAYFAFMVPLYSESLRKTQTNPKKIYLIDSGMMAAYSTSVSSKFGSLFENLVYLDLRRKEHKIYYYLTRERYEIDFLTKSLDGCWHLYQVCYDVDDQATLQREMRALQAAEQELGIKGELITPETYGMI